MRDDVVHAFLVAAYFWASISGCAPEPSGPQLDAPRVPTLLPGSDLAEGSATGAAPGPKTGAEAATGKATSPVLGAFRWDSSRALAPGEIAEFFLDVTPEVSVDALSVSVTHTGDLEVLSAKEVDLGAVASSDTRVTPIRVRMANPGRVELRASVAGRDSAGTLLFQTSYPLYLILVDDRVLAGIDGFAALELADLERRNAAGDITDEEYERAKRRIHGGGAAEVITVTPPPPGSS